MTCAISSLELFFLRIWESSRCGYLSLTIPKSMDLSALARLKQTLNEHQYLLII